MKSKTKANLYSQLPSVDKVLRSSELAGLVAREGQASATEAIRSVLARVRSEIAAGRIDARRPRVDDGRFSAAIERETREALTRSLRQVINATGVILHTNLGRAPLAAAALEHIGETSSGYSNLEFDVASGERGKRDAHVDRLFQKLLEEDSRMGADSRPALGELSSTTAPNLASTIVVNNNAAAVLLVLNTLAEGGEVIVSRGELVEIGESFRIPDVMSKSGARLREVGTTNRTRVEDYEDAITENTRLLLRVHRSNFQITGFTEQPTLDQLVEFARRRGLPLVEDLGSGALFDLRCVGVSGEPSVAESLRAGVDVVTYSGDKLLGGPQAGILSGRGELIARMRANSLFRALRVDKLTYAALEATLLVYVRREHDAIPVLRMMRLAKQEIGRRAEAVAAKIQRPGLTVKLIDGESVIGGGAAPSATLPTRLLAVAAEGLTAHELAAPPALLRATHCCPGGRWERCSRFAHCLPRAG